MKFDILEHVPLLAGAFFLCLYGAFFLGAAVVVRRTAWVPYGTTDRFGHIDGLRGSLAIGVFAHHAFTARRYFLTGEWDWSSSAVLNHLGQSTVSLFFMITGFLFTLKGAAPRVEWTSFYVSRFARLTPLHAVVVILVFVLVLAISPRIVEPYWRLATEMMAWQAFALFGRPDINGFRDTWVLVAGVTWSLKFEVLFYLVVVPALHVGFRAFGAARLAIICGALFAVILAVRSLLGSGPGATLWASHFLGGIVVALLHKQGASLSCTSAVVRNAIVMCGVAVLLFAPNGYASLQVLATVVIFAAVVGGFSCFGLFKLRPAVWLGEVSYGVYLLHGLALWGVLFALRETGLLRSWGLGGYWLAMMVLSVGVLALASASYIWVERPAMRTAKLFGSKSRSLDLVHDRASPA